MLTFMLNTGVVAQVGGDIGGQRFSKLHNQDSGGSSSDHFGILFLSCNVLVVGCTTSTLLIANQPETVVAWVASVTETSTMLVRQQQRPFIGSSSFHMAQLMTRGGGIGLHVAMKIQLQFPIF